LVYNLQRVFYKPIKTTSISTTRRDWINDNKKIILCLIGLGFIGTVYFVFNDLKQIIIYLLPLFILSIIYFLSFINLRSNAWLKNFTLAFVWTTVTAVIPLLLNDNSLSYLIDNKLHIASRFLFMLAICIPFDIRDLKIDKYEGVITIPQILGERKSVSISVLCMLLYIGIIVFEYSLGVYPLLLLSTLIIAALINVTIVYLTSSKQNEYYYIGLLDGTMIIQGVIVLISNNFT
jgi:4-hydroxybenzoate polyprenyltransferase